MTPRSTPVTRRAAIVWAAAGALAALCGCATRADRPGDDPTAGNDPTDEAPARGTEGEGLMGEIALTVNGTRFAAALEGTPAAAALLDLLPVTLRMSELNGNEKYAYLDGPLPTDASCPGTIEAGDLMLFGDDCLVLFYRSFPTSYRYTRLGRVGDATGLAEACGDGPATVAWELAGPRGN